MFNDDIYVLCMLFISGMTCGFLICYMIYSNEIVMYKHLLKRLYRRYKEDVLNDK